MSDVTPDAPPTVIAVLAGGASRRMGTDKAMLARDGVPLLWRTAAAAADAAGGDERVLVVGRARPEWWPTVGEEVRFVPDETPGVGPLGGLATALAHAEGADVLAVACDMPDLTADALRWLLDADVRASAGIGAEDGTVAVNDDRPEPLFCVYRPASVGRIREHLAAGRRSLRALLNGGRFARVSAPPPVRARLTNVNTPEEFQRAMTREI